MRILRARPTRRFLYLLVRCRCGKRFGQRGDRPLIVCFHCGRASEATRVPWAGSLPVRARRPRKSAAAPTRSLVSSLLARGGKPPARPMPGSRWSRLERRVGVLYRRLVPARRRSKPTGGKS